MPSAPPARFLHLCSFQVSLRVKVDGVDTLVHLRPGEDRLTVAQSFCKRHNIEDASCVQRLEKGLQSLFAKQLAKNRPVPRLPSTASSGQSGVSENTAIQSGSSPSGISQSAAVISTAGYSTTSSAQSKDNTFPAQISGEGVGESSPAGMNSKERETSNVRSPENPEELSGGNHLGNLSGDEEEVSKKFLLGRELRQAVRRLSPSVSNSNQHSFLSESRPPSERAPDSSNVVETPIEHEKKKLHDIVPVTENRPSTERTSTPHHQRPLHTTPRSSTSLPDGSPSYHGESPTPPKQQGSGTPTERPRDRASAEGSGDSQENPPRAAPRYFVSDAAPHGAASEPGAGSRGSGDESGSDAGQPGGGLGQRTVEEVANEMKGSMGSIGITDHDLV